MAIEFLIIAGPQAAGKSTLGKQLCYSEPSFVPLEESRQTVIHNAKKKGAIFMTDLDELEVIHDDMTGMFAIPGQNRVNRAYLMSSRRTVGRDPNP